MKTLGLDMSTRSTGYAVFENDKLVDYGIIKNSEKDWRLRVIAMGWEIGQLMKNVKPNVVVCEDVFVSGKHGKGNNNSSVMIKLSVLQGFVLGLFSDRNQKYEYVTPTKWRSKLEGVFSGKRKGTTRPELKANTVAYVNKNFGLDLFYDKERSVVKNQDDIADAIGIAYSYILSQK